MTQKDLSDNIPTKLAFTALIFPTSGIFRLEHARASNGELQYTISADMSKRPVKNPLQRSSTKTSVWSQSNAEVSRLKEDKERKQNWKRWGPYLSERQWGTVREDYSSDGGWYVMK